MADDQDTSEVDDEVLDSAADNAADSVGSSGEAAAASFQFRDALRGRGYELPDEVDDDAFLNQIEQWSSRASALPEDVDADTLPTLLQAGREFQQNQAEFEQWRASRQQQASPQQQTQQSAAQVQQPQLTAGREAQAAKAAGYTAADIAEAKQFCSFDQATGMWVPKHPFHGEAAKALNEVAMRAQRNMEEFGIDPDGFVQSRAVSAVEKRVQELLEERLGKIMPDIEEFRQFRTLQLQQQFIAPIVSDLYVLDEHGAVKAKTPRGEVFERAHAEAPQGLTELQRLEYARNAADAWALRNPPQQKQQPGNGLFSMKKQASAADAKKPVDQKPSDTKTPSDDAGGKRRRFVDRLRTRGADGRFVGGDRSGTVKQPVQSTKRQSAREVYQALKSGELPMDDE